jgi:hypothetical protein
MPVWGRKGREKGKRFDFLMIAGNCFRIVPSCPLRANIFLSQHFPGVEMPLLENVRFTLFEVSITHTLFGSAKPWRPQMPMEFHYLSTIIIILLPQFENFLTSHPLSNRTIPMWPLTQTDTKVIEWFRGNLQISDLCSQSEYGGWSHRISQISSNSPFVNFELCTLALSIWIWTSFRVAFRVPIRAPALTPCRTVLQK